MINLYRKEQRRLKAEALNTWKARDVIIDLVTDHPQWNDEFRAQFQEIIDELANLASILESRTLQLYDLEQKFYQEDNDNGVGPETISAPMPADVEEELPY